MKIIAFEAENIKRIAVASIKPDGSPLVEITGKNRQGKTSVLDAIFWALAGAEAIQSKPIRKGADRALIRLDLGELVVTRRFTAQDDGGFTTSIKVENAEGASFKTPQTMLDKLLGKLTFDPLEFTRMKPADQFEACRKFVPHFDFDAFADAQNKDFTARTEVNRSAKQLRAQAEGINFETLSEGARDESELVAQLEQAGVTNADIELRRANREKAAADAERFEQDALALKGRANEKREQAARLVAEAEAEEKRAADWIAEGADLKARILEAGPLPAPVETQAIKDAIAAAREHNGRVAAAMEAAKRKRELETQAAAAEKQSTDLTAQMDARNKTKLAAIAQATLPVEGLSFGDNCILLDGLPFDQGSDAQQLEASVAIAAAMNPKLRVIRIRDGSLLDKEAFELLGEFAQRHDMQIWVETVASGRPGAVVIEDGRVAGAEEKPAAEKTEAA
jgi:hypothetical protein